MEKSLFRKKSIEQLSAPEELTGYLRVTGPGVWVVLTGIMILLAGFAVWGIMGTVITTVTAPAIVEEGTVSCYILKDDSALTDSQIEITIGDVRMYSAAEDAEAVTMNASDDPFLFASGYLSPGKNVMVLTCSTTLTDGYYDAVVTTEKCRPISLLFSKN